MVCPLKLKVAWASMTLSMLNIILFWLTHTCHHHKWILGFWFAKKPVMRCFCMNKTPKIVPSTHKFSWLATLKRSVKNLLDTWRKLLTIFSAETFTRRNDDKRLSGINRRSILKYLGRGAVRFLLKNYPRKACSISLLIDLTHRKSFSVHRFWALVFILRFMSYPRLFINPCDS